MRLPLTTRALISKEFGIAKTGPTHVADNKIVSDGYPIEAVETALNLEAMKNYVGVVQTDLGTLFELVVAKIEGRETVDYPLQNVAAVEIKAGDIVPGEVVLIKPKRKYTKKKK